MPIDINDSHRQGHVVLPELVHQPNVLLVRVGVCYQLLPAGRTHNIGTTNYRVTIEGSKVGDQRQ